MLEHHLELNATAKGLSHRSKEHRNADGLLSARHGGGIEGRIVFNESLWSAKLWARDSQRRRGRPVLSVECQIAQLSPRDLSQGAQRSRTEARLSGRWVENAVGTRQPCAY